jgi:hypothetical protein
MRRGSMLLLVVLVSCLAALATSASAWADNYGELSRFGLGAGEFKINEETVAFGVNPTDNSLYVGEEAPPKAGVESGKYRIQRFTAGGGLLASSPVLLNPRTKVGTPSSGIEGIAVDTALNRIYVLGPFESPAALDEGEPAAGTLYALNAETLASVVPVNPGGTAKEKKEQEEGVLSNVTALKANSKNAGEALLRPSGIAVDPTTHDVVLLGEVDLGKIGPTKPEPQPHLALERVTSAGGLRPNRYIDPKIGTSEADSPVVTSEGTVLAEQRHPADNHELLIQVPGTESGSEPSVAFQLPPKTFGPKLESTSFEELVEAPSESIIKGAGLALAGEGSSKATAYSEAEIAEQTLVGGEIKFGELGFPGVLAVGLVGKEGTVTSAERGWTGGQILKAGETAPCVIAESTGTGAGQGYPMVAAGKEERLFVLVPQTMQVVEFGPAGGGCPHATVPAVPSIEASVGELPPSEEVPNEAEVKLSSTLVEGNVLSVEWDFGDGSAPETVAPGQYQVSETKHVFKEPGNYTITEKIKTDNLATPEVVAKRTLAVRYATTLTTALTAEGHSATSILVNEHTSVTDKATLAGTHAAEAKGTVTYKLYSDNACTKEVGAAGTVPVTAGSVPASEAKTLPPGTYYWQASYSGDGVNESSTSACGSEIEKVAVLSAATLTTTLAGEGRSGASITVKEGTAVSDVGSLAGVNAAEATGTVTYTVYSDVACSKEVASAGTVAVSAGSVPASEAKTFAPGTYYWRASYGGDPFNLASTSACGSEIETVEAPPVIRPAPPSAGGVLSFTSFRVGLAGTSLSVNPNGTTVAKVACLGTSSCVGTLALRTLNAVSASAHKSILTLASGSFNLAGGQTKAITLHLSAKARKLLARVHVLRARATIVARDSSGTSHTATATVTLRLAKHHH